MAATSPVGSSPQGVMPTDGNAAMATSGASWEQQYEERPVTADTMEQLEESVPVEMLWVTLQRKRKHSYFFKLLTWTIFVAIFTALTQMLRPVRATFTVQDSLLEHTAREPFPQAGWAKTFYDITSDADWWEWVESVLLPNILSDKYFNGDPRSTAWGSRFLNTVSMYNTQTAPVRFRQARVKDDSCDTPAGNSELSRPCWGDFSVSRQFKQAFGESYGNRFLTDLNAIGGKEGFGRDYGTEAYVVDVPLHKGNALATVDQMKKGLWLNEQTRAVTVETNWYNANVDLSTYLMLHIDVSPGGRFQPYVVIHSCRLSPYSATMDYVRGGLEAAFTVMVVCFLMAWMWDLRDAIDRKAYLMSLWNLLELLNLLSFVFIILCWGIYMAKDKKAFEVVSSATYNNRPDLSGLVANFNMSSNFAAFSLVCSYAKLFKCAQLFPSLGLLWRALELSAVDMAPFLFIFLLFACAFTFAGHWVFGYTMIEFHNWGQSFTTLFQSLMGGLPYEGMSQDAPISAAFFTFAWVLMMCMVFSSMFVAILTQWYFQVHEESLNEQRNLAQKVGPQASDGFFTIAWRRLQCLFGGDSEEAEFDQAAREVQRFARAARADFTDLEWIRKAMISGKPVNMADISGHFRGNDRKAAEFVAQVRELADVEAKIRDKSLVRKFGDKMEEQGEEQERLQKLQATVGRLESDLKQLRGALHDSYIARTAAGQSLDGYTVDNSTPGGTFSTALPGAVQDS